MKKFNEELLRKLEEVCEDRTTENSWHDFIVEENAIKYRITEPCTQLWPSVRFLFSNGDVEKEVEEHWELKKELEDHHIQFLKENGLAE